MKQRLKDYYVKHPWKARLFLAFSTIILLILILRLILSPSIIYAANSFLKTHGIESSIEDINIGIIDGTVSLVNAEGLSEGKPLFHIGLVEIHWQWKPLSKKTIHITKIVLDELQVDIKQYTDSIVIGGVNIPLGSDEPVEQATLPPEQDSMSWAANLGEVVFTDLNICYQQQALTKELSTTDSAIMDYCVSLAKMAWGGSIGYATDSSISNDTEIPLSSSGNFLLNGLTVTDNRLRKDLLVSENSELNNVTISGLNDISIEQLKMENLSLLQRDDTAHKDSVRFSQLLIDDITFRNLNALKLDSIDVSSPGIYLVKLDKDSWEYQRWLPAVSGTDTAEPPPATTDTGTDRASVFSVSIKQLNINNSDLCYLEKGISLYYCLTLDKLNWQGQLDYSTEPADTADLNMTLKGELSLASLNIKNHTLSRNLVDFKTLTLSKLDIVGSNNISLAQLDLETLTALQRGNDASDNTAAFDRLTIDDIKHAKNSIAIDKIVLSGLSNTVSKNSNGEWEHGKWLISQTPEKAAESNDDKKAEPAAKQVPEDEDKLIIAINTVKLVTDKDIKFIDNSTEPAMDVGLKNLKFHIDKLYSQQPETDSPFELSAKTTRHSTIDIAGTVRPFSDNVSFDAEGKLKGFDLRAASPATIKAIGHRIQSGQLDADLDLKAVAGKLDSNISLSLYKFRIKPESKKDAEALDEKFGMPLDKTLVLLRQKDDSIHLDIPITGDVNNPNFNPMDAIITATSKAATVTLITFYTPYGLLYAGGNLAFDLATALNFDPITFTPGSSELQGENKAQLDKLSMLMTEKPGVHLTLCGVTNQQDAAVLFPDFQAQLNDSKKTATPFSFSSSQLEKLETLGQQRQVNSKNYLIAEHGIAHERLILCTPEHKTDEEAVAGVEINI